ncbi:NF038104 family lipoprotein [Necropsobacter massiliensis]|uniref:NF038104 family lipoprotein n=1 Tax=Necropsobacter massiliensis TaxID=1400001 RepID=UPI000595CD0E|nr:NF038104 family lipoprotein [Necropsobacter massiliensis]
MTLFTRLLCIALGCALLNGCIVTSAVGLAVGTVATAGKVAVKTTGAVIDAVTPDDDEDDDD